MYGTCSTSGYGARVSGGCSVDSYAPPAVVTQTAPSPFRYEVQEGDSLARVARKLNTTEERLLELNPIIATKKHRVKLYPGQQLVVEEANQVSLPPPPDFIDYGWGQMHLVRSGETLDTIAALYNTTEEQIRHDNRRFFPAGERGILYPGQMLHIRLINIGEIEPEMEVDDGTEEEEDDEEDHRATNVSKNAVPTKYKTHLVTEEDTFESICKSYNITYARLLQINRGRYPVGARAELIVNERLIVPDWAASQRDARLRNIGEVKLTKQIHIVQHGETPESIARLYDMTYDEMREWNRVYFPKGYRGEIRPGYKLVVKRNERRNSSDYDPIDEDDD